MHGTISFEIISIHLSYLNRGKLNKQALYLQTCFYRREKIHILFSEGKIHGVSVEEKQWEYVGFRERNCQVDWKYQTARSLEICVIL